jgi:predicted outer membrane protein
VGRSTAILLALALGLLVAGCGGGKNESERTELGQEAKAACTGSPLAAAPKLPASFPQIEADKLAYTRQSTQGPTNVVEGYFNGDVEEAHDEFEKELKGAGFTILFNELEEHDSEISWQGEGRTGQVALREECGDSDKTYVHITNRPA